MASVEVTGRKLFGRAAYTIPEFCRAYSISVRTYFNMRDEGLGPREMGIGRAVRISLAAADEWSRACEKLRKDRLRTTETEAATAAA
jgi:hypothetical protein